jgi:hypothetical protein
MEALDFASRRRAARLHLHLVEQALGSRFTQKRPLAIDAEWMTFGKAVSPQPFIRVETSAHFPAVRCLHPAKRSQCKSAEGSEECAP